MESILSIVGIPLFVVIPLSPLSQVRRHCWISSFPLSLVFLTAVVCGIMQRQNGVTYRQYLEVSHDLTYTKHPPYVMITARQWSHSPHLCLGAPVKTVLDDGTSSCFPLYHLFYSWLSTLLRWTICPLHCPDMIPWLKHAYMGLITC